MTVSVLQFIMLVFKLILLFSKNNIKKISKPNDFFPCVNEMNRALGHLCAHIG